MKHLKTFEAINEEYYSKYHSYISSKTISGLKILIDSGVDINTENSNGWTPITLAADEMYNADINSINFKILEMIINAGGDWNIKSHKGDFIEIITNVNPKISKYIIEKYQEKYQDYLIKKDVEKYNI